MKRKRLQQLNKKACIEDDPDNLWMEKPDTSDVINPPKKLNENKCLKLQNNTLDLQHVLKGVICHDDASAINDLISMSNKGVSSVCFKHVVTMDELLILSCEYNAIHILHAIFRLTPTTAETNFTPGDNRCDIIHPIHLESSNERNPVLNTIISLRKYRKISSENIAALRKLGPTVFQPLINAFVHVHYQTIELISSFSPIYFLHFLLSKITFPSNYIDSDSNKPTIRQEDSDFHRCPMILFQLIEDDRYLGLTLGLQSSDRLLHTDESQSISNHCLTSKSNRLVSLVTDGSLKNAEVLKVLRKVDDEGGTIAHWAAEADFPACLSQLIRLDPYLGTVTDNNGLTPLHSACMMGSISCVDTLLSAIKSNDASTYLLDSTDIAKTDADGWSPFLYAVYREHVPCALKLLQQRNYAKVSQLTYESDSFIISNSSSKSGSFPSSSSSSSSSLSSSRIMVMNEYVSDAKLFELYDKDQATSQLRLLGQIISCCTTGDDRARSALESLACVPEFHQLVNAILRADVDLLDSDLGYLVRHPALLDIDNKLLVMRKACIQIHYSNLQKTLTDDNISLMEIGKELFPILCPYETLHRNDPWIRSILHHTLDQRLYHRASVMCLPNQIKVLKLSRDHAWKDLLEISNKKGAGEDIYGIDLFRHRLMLQFVGVGEEGSGPGVERELFDIISSQLVWQKPSATVDYKDRMAANKLNEYALFVPIIDHQNNEDDHITHSGVVYQPIPDPVYSANSNYDKIPTMFSEQQRNKMYSTFGRLLGQLLLRSLSGDTKIVNIGLSSLLSINLPAPFWKLVLGHKVTLDDVSDFDPQLYSSLLWLRENKHSEDLDLDFTVAVPCPKFRGDESTHVIPLIEGGSNIRVNDSNKEKYISYIVRHKIVDPISKAAAAVRNGLLRIIPLEVLNLFKHRELSVLLAGSEDIDPVEWEKHTTYDGISSSYVNKLVQLFWTLVQSLTHSERNLLLKFCTGSSKLPVGGFCNLKPKFRIMIIPFNESRTLPTAATCFNLLRLPEYPTETMLRKNIMIALMYGTEGFSFT